MHYSRLFTAIISFTTMLCSPIKAVQKVSLPKEVPFKMEDLKKGQVNIPNSDTQKIPSSNTAVHRISGQISSASNSSLSFHVPGFIKQILYKPGSVVKKGEVLAKLDVTDYELQLNIAKAKRSQAQIQEKSAKNDLNREKMLKSEDASTEVQLEKIETSYQQAQVSYQLAELQVKNAQINLDNTNLRAPYDCVIAKQYQERAEHVNVGTKVFDIYEVNTTEIDLNVPEILINKLHIGSKLIVSVPSTQYSDEATVISLVPIVSEVTRTFKVKAKFKSNDKRIVPGLFAEAQIVEPRQ